MATSGEGSHFSAGTWAGSLAYKSLFPLLPLPVFLIWRGISSSDLPSSLFFPFLIVVLSLSSLSCPRPEGVPSSCPRLLFLPSPASASHSEPYPVLWLFCVYLVGLMLGPRSRLWPWLCSVSSVLLRGQATLGNGQWAFLKFASGLQHRPYCL